MQNKNLFEFVSLLRQFFYAQGFLETMSPPMVENPGMEPHIHPFQLYSPASKKLLPYYLHTSPEFHLKELLSKDPELTKIYSLSYVFRDEPISPIHRPQFLMLEWYRVNKNYEDIIDDLQNLFEFLRENRKNQIKEPLKVMTMENIWKEVVHFSPLDFLSRDDFYQKIKKDLPSVPLPVLKSPEWDDLFFLVFLNLIEPHLKKWPLLIIKEFPAPLSALSQICQHDERVCERFELYINGIEIANCYGELTDYEEQKKRFSEAHQLKKKLYEYELQKPERFLNAIEQGLPPSTGIALGVERLLGAISKNETHFFD